LKSLPEILTIHLPRGLVAPPVNPYGRQVANAGLFRALARHGGYRGIHVQSLDPLPADRLARELFPLGTDATGVALSSGTPLSTEVPSSGGILLSGQPYLSELAWIRRHSAADHDYSIIGTIFAFASPTHRELMMESALAPLHDWDALICTSPSLKLAVQRTFEIWEDYLRERTGAVRLPKPALPVIPLGVDLDGLRARAEDASARKTLRNAHGIAKSDLVVFFLGRLSFSDKAFPQAMLKAVEAAQRISGVKTHFIMSGWFPGGEKDRSMFEEAARCHAPNVNVLFLDGNDAAIVAGCWAAADIFLSLSDTILETFGQALTEAMSAGLPLVVSDWDGYRSIVRNEVDGFLIPTLGAPGGCLGETLAHLQSFEMVSYYQYVGAVAQHTAIHVGRAAEALAALISSPELRRKMGSAGRQRARDLFSWPVIVAQYNELFSELTERRLAALSAQGAALPAVHRMNPLRGDPFEDFRGHPSAVMKPGLRLRLAAGGGDDPLGTGMTAGLDHLFPGLRGTAEETHRLICLLREQGSLSVKELLSPFPAARRPFVRMSLAWLAKLGILDWLPAVSVTRKASGAESR
jgi:glycosyltransferase involved in cell wall biosynthesis